MNRTASLRLRADIALVAVCLIWGSTFVIVKEALNEVSTILFLTVRFTIAALALGVIFRGSHSHHHWRKWRELRAGSIAGLCLFSGYVLQTTGLRYTTAAKTGFITGFYIPLVPALGSLFYRRMPSLAEAAGIGMATIGMSLMTLKSFSFDIARGDLLVLGCSFAYALHILLLGYYARHIAFERLTFYQVATGALLGLASFAWVETPRWHLTGQVAFALGLTGLLATAFAFAVQTWAQQFTTPTRTALIFSLEPVFAWLTSFLVSGEVLTGRVLAGAVLILAGIFTVELQPKGGPAPAEHLEP
jgi:drug/metabolite transporter (DMT)-like permease